MADESRFGRAAGKMASGSQRNPEVPEEQKEQAEAKVEKRAERQADVEAAVSVITDALQQHAISTGGQQPTQAPAATGVADFAALLRSAEAHFWLSEFRKRFRNCASACTGFGHSTSAGTCDSSPNCQHRGEATAIGDVAWRSCRQKDRPRGGREGPK